MKAAILFFFILCTAFATAQKHHFVTPVNDAEQTSPQFLAKKLTASSKNEYEKVSAIFHWITDNIEYNTGIFYRVPRKAPIRFPVPELHDTAALPSKNDRVAESVLSRRMAVCDGYARLFASVCNYAGIKAEVITGYAQTDGIRNPERFRSNHTWNAVRLDSVWYLLDATWASGYVTYSNQFVPYYNPVYFLTPPAQFAHDHYPEDLRWTLLPQPPSLKEFQWGPFKYQAFLKFKIHSFSPAAGVIEAVEGDTVKIELETGIKEKKLFATAIPITDSLLELYEKEQADTATTDGKKVMYHYTVNEHGGKWLHVLFNNEPILRYQLQIKKKETTAFIKQDQNLK